MGERRFYLQDCIATYRGLKPEERKQYKANIRNAAGWPLESMETRSGIVYVRFGRPLIPLYMDFELLRKTVWYVQLNGFQANMGGLPQLVEFHIHRFMNFDPEADIWDEAADALESKIMLTDMDIANPLVISERYYGCSSNPLLGMALPGYLSTKWQGIMCFLHRQRAADHMTPSRAAKLLERYIRNQIECLKGKIQSGGFQSARILQGLSVLSKFDKTPLSEIKCRPYYTHLRQNKVPLSIRHDLGLVSSYLFYVIFEDKNRDCGLNAGNLELGIELLTGGLGYLLGQENETSKFFFQGMMIMGGAGSYKMTTKDGVLVTARQKPNGTGADKIVEEVNSLFGDLLLKNYGIPLENNSQTYINASRWTPVALENMGCYEVVDGNVVGIPDETLRNRPMVCTEARGNNGNLGPAISCVWPRNDGQPTFSATTVDREKNNVRQLSAKIRQTFPNLVFWSSNQPCADAVAAEEVKTACAVTATMHPGAPAYEKHVAKEARFNNVSTTKFQGRQRVNNDEPRQSILSLLVPHSHIIAAIFGSLPNQSVMCKFEISEPVLCFLDWTFLYIRNHLSSVLEVDVKDSFSRIREGYESRGVASSLYKTVMALVAQDKTVDEIAFETNMQMMQSAIPLSEVRRILFVFSRCRW